MDLVKKLHSLLKWLLLLLKNLKRNSIERGNFWKPPE